LLVLALLLDSQEVADVDVTDDRVKVVRDGRSPAGRLRWDERRWADESHVRSHGHESFDVAAGHPAVKDVSDDGHLEALEVLEVLANREQVEKSLRRMFVGAVTGV
jgi:hypothetical protein